MAVNPITKTNGNGAQALPAIPFRKATLFKSSPMRTIAIPATLGGRENIEIDSKGYMASLGLFVSGTETTTTADPGATSDFPWSLFKRIEVRDSAAGALFSLPGYAAYLAERFFHPKHGRNLATVTDTRIYAANIAPVQANDIRFSINIHIETGTRDNLGLVPNQNASFKYALTLEYEDEANLVTTPANATWNLSVTPSYRYYIVPTPTRSDKRPQQTRPPFAGIVRQQLFRPTDLISNQLNRVQILVGRVYRGFILITRDNTNARVNGIDRLSLKFGDDNLLFDMTEQDIIERNYRLYGETPPTGVYPIVFTADADNLVGADNRNDILDTRRLSQMYFEMTTKNNATVLEIVEDVLIVPQNRAL